MIDLFLETVLDMDDGSFTIAKSPIALSPVVFAFLHILTTKKYKKNARKEAVRNFTSVFLVHLMHLQVRTCYLILLQYS